MILQDITLFIYNIALLPVIFFTVLFMVLAILNLVIDTKKERAFKKLKQLPFVSVQVPTFNDPIAARCIEHCMQFDYPKDKYEIIIVDDSTDINTQMLLKKYADDNPSFIKYAHRTNRQGYKPGALKEAMSITKGEILVVFDSDWIPNKDFLKKVVKPFSDPKVALVQTRQGFYNKDTNLLTRFAAYVLMIYHSIVLPINNKINCVFFCGTAGAIRRSHFEEVGGWNTHSITEDSELSVKFFMKGYKSVYFQDETPSEVPETFEALIKQQMRWCYGNVRVFMDNAKEILLHKQLSITQKLMISYLTLGNFIAPIVVIMTVFGLSGWFLGDPQLLRWQDIFDLASRFIFTGGFFLVGFITLYKRNMLKEFPQLVLSAFTIGLIIAISNSVAFFKAVFNQKLYWYCTPKKANDQRAS